MEQGRPPMDTNWQANLGQEARQKIVKRIMDTLQKHMPHSGPWRLEEKIFQSAAGQQDYLRRISVKMLLLESKSQGTLQNQVAADQQQPVQQEVDSTVNGR